MAAKRALGVAERVRRSYEKRPYPGLERTNAAKWPIAPIEWIEAMWQPQTAPRRILIAGCGTGNEAFAFARRFPEAEIVGVDFCARSIALAKRAQRLLQSSPTLRLVCADLASPELRKAVGRGFDFISCHGVLSYIPQPRVALRNFAQCLARSGALYLGVNGAQHFSASWRRALPRFGFEIGEFQPRRSLPATLAFFEAVAGHKDGWMSKRDAPYLSSDLFAPLMSNWPWRNGSRSAVALV
jgi:SAM-dependent methyltransferase